MYGETQLNSIWFPSRIEMINANLVQSTIIYSDKAFEHNIVGVDLHVPVGRTKLLEDPTAEDTTVIREDQNAYGKAQIKGGRPHRRRVSALPDYIPTLPINPKKVFPGISDDHIELLDHCVGKLIQRTGKVDVTWEELAVYSEMGMTIHSQAVDDGTSRYQVNFEVQLPLEECATALLNNERSSLHLEQKQLEVEKLEHFSDDFYILKQRVRAGRGLYQESRHSDKFSIGPPKESIVYWWNIRQEDKIYSTFVSMEPDDELGYAAVDEKSDLIRTTYNPGCGYIMEKRDNMRTKVSYLVHFQLGGFFPKVLIDNLVLRNFYLNTRGLVCVCPVCT